MTREIFYIVIRTGSGCRQNWEMVEEANKSFENTPPLVIVENNETKKTERIMLRRGSQFLVTPPYTEDFSVAYRGSRD